jgi:hypothetical protein
MDNYQDLKQSLIDEKNAISSELPWLIAVKLHYAPDLEGYDMIVANSEDFIWEDSNGTELIFKLFPFTMNGVSFTSSGKFPDVQLNLFNTATIAKYAEDNNCFLGLNITIYFINIKACSEYNADNYPLKFDFVVTDGTIGNYITLKLSSPNYLTRLIPSVRYYRDYCPYEYRREFCWMKDVPIENIMPQDLVCNKSFTTCTKYKWAYQRFLPEDIRGVRYGGFPNLSKGTAYYY